MKFTVLREFSHLGLARERGSSIELPMTPRVQTMIAHRFLIQADEPAEAVAVPPSKTVKTASTPKG